MPKKAVAHPRQQSTAKSQPVAKRVKVSLACVVCRKKKVKCDGVQPTCSRCGSMGLACEYSDPPRKRGPPKGYVEVIESRAHRIESLLGKNHVLTARKTSLPPPIEETSLSGSGFAPTNIVLDIMAGMAGRCLSENAPGSHDRYAYLSPLDIPREQALVWAEHFFGCFNLLFPLLSRHHFLHELTHCSPDNLVRNAVLALGGLYANLHHADVVRQTFQFCEQALTRSGDPTSLSTLQTLVIMCWYAFLSGDIHGCHTLRRRMVRVLGDLDLYHDPDMSLGIVQMELRRRAFWVAYVMDQWLATATGEQLMPLQQHWDCKWPKLEDSQLHAIDSRKLSAGDLASNVTYALQITAFPEMIKLAQIVDRFLTTRQPMASSLTSWLLALPSYLEYQKPADDSPPSPVTRIYHMLYYTVQILLHQPSSVSGDLGASICTTAASTIVHIAEQMVQHHQEHFLYNVAMLSLTLATSIHLLHATDHDMPGSINLDKSIRVLQCANCTSVSVLELDCALEHYLLQCGTHLGGYHPHDASSSPRDDTSLSDPSKQASDLSTIDALLGLGGLFTQEDWQWLDGSAAAAPHVQAPIQTQLSCSSASSSYTPPESLSSFFSPSQSPMMSWDAKSATDVSVPTDSCFYYGSSLVDLYAHSMSHDVSAAFEPTG